MNETPKCPGCGADMWVLDGVGWCFCCCKCGWTSPIEKTRNEALEKAMKRAEEKNRVLTLEEARNAEADTFGTAMHWLELKIRPYTCEGEEIKFVVLAVSMFFEDESGNDEPGVLYSCAGEPDAWLLQKDYGLGWRCWLRKPTKEEMEGTPWES